jgi:hypothetical protein
LTVKTTGFEEQTESDAIAHTLENNQQIAGNLPWSMFLAPGDL